MMKEIKQQGLVQIVRSSGLEEVERKVIIEKFDDYEGIAKEWEAKAKTIQVTDAGQITEMKMAREARLFLGKKRRDVEIARKEMKQQSLRKGQAIDSIAKYLVSLIEPIEKYLKEQENFIEIQAKIEVDRVKKEMEDKAEQDRIELQRKEELLQSRRIKIAPYFQFERDIELNTETSTVEFDKLFNSLEKQKTDYDAKQAQIVKENEQLRKESIEKERVANLEEEKRNKAKIAEEKKLAREREKAKMEHQQLEAERDEAEQELAKKEEAERLAVAESERIEKEAKKEEIRVAKNKKYKNWLIENKFDKKTMKVERDGSTFTLLKIISEITI